MANRLLAYKMEDGLSNICYSAMAWATSLILSLEFITNHTKVFGVLYVEPASLVTTRRW